MDEGAKAAAGRILVTGASGYIGSRLVPLLLEQGRTVRAMSRDASRLRGRGWDAAELVGADALEPESLPSALAGVHTCYYLIHSMASGGGNFEARDRLAAANFARAAREAGVQHIIYLGGLGETSAALSPHLRSRLEVGRLLRESGVPVTMLRAAIVIGAGSASFEIMVDLVRNLPVMVVPRWMSTRCQPIAVRDVKAYLAGILDAPACWGRDFDLGGPDILTYREMLEQLAREMGRRVVIIPVPFLTPRLSSYWISLFTPVSVPLIRALVESLRNEVIARDSAIEAAIPIRKTPYREAIQLAFTRIATQTVPSRWSGSPGPARTHAYPGHVTEVRAGEIAFTDRRQLVVPANITTTYRAVAQVGGDVGWYKGSWLWWLRGWLDRLAGGPGYRRGRRHPQDLLPGDTVNFWRVEAVNRPDYVLLRAEMKLPGTAWLEFELAEVAPGHTRVIQTAHFHARGLAGKVYWLAIAPLHAYVFLGLLAGIGRAAAIMTGQPEQAAVSPEIRRPARTRPHRAKSNRF